MYSSSRTFSCMAIRAVSSSARRPMLSSRTAVKPVMAINIAPEVRTATGTNRVVLSVVTHQATAPASSVHQNSMEGV